MAISKTDLFAYVKDYQSGNSRPCPKSDILANHGEDALAVLKELIADGTVSCRRGRNGGYFPLATSTEVAEEPAVEVENDVADQFAALQARLAAAEAAESEEPLPANP